MSVTSTVYSISPAQLKKLKGDNDLLGAVFGEDEGADASFKVPSHAFADFEDTHRLLHCAGLSTLRKTLDFELGSDEALDYGGYDIRVATPAQVKKIATELAGATLEKVRTKGIAAEFKTDRTRELPSAEGYAEQFAEIERARDFFAAAAKAGNAVIAAAI